jgi:hypothetical protein
MSKTMRVTLPFVFFAVAATLSDREAAADPPTASDIVTAADRARNPQQPFRVTLALTEYVRGAPRDSVTLVVHSKFDGGTHQFKNLVRYAGPPRDAGKLVLLNASNMWFYDPAAKSSIRISPQQRLTGQASDGDVLTVNLAHDYTPALLGEETLADADRAQRNVWHLGLTASTGEALYARLEYWVEKDSGLPVKAKFYSDSGRPLKIAYFRKYEPQLGAVRPTETIIIDAVDANLVTKIAYSDFRSEPVQDAWFQRDFLPRFQEE